MSKFVQRFSRYRLLLILYSYTAPIAREASKAMQYNQASQPKQVHVHIVTYSHLGPSCYYIIAQYKIALTNDQQRAPHHALVLEKQIDVYQCSTSVQVT